MQGVGFRPFVYRLANDLQLSGSVRNDPTGVTVMAVAPSSRLDEFEVRLRAEAPPLASIDDVQRQQFEPAVGTEEGFRIIQSDHQPAVRGRVTVDSSVCDDCLRELFDENDRRKGHPLINCTNCGPRYTIIRDLPYDRPLTTMAPFPMCDRCAREYRDPSDRRFHAQPTCCPGCGPRLMLIERHGHHVDNPMAGAARILCKGGVLVMKGKSVV